MILPITVVQVVIMMTDMDSEIRRGCVKIKNKSLRIEYLNLLSTSSTNNLLSKKTLFEF